MVETEGQEKESTERAEVPGGHVLPRRSASGRFQEGAARELQAGLTGAVDEDWYTFIDS